MFEILNILCICFDISFSIKKMQSFCIEMGTKYNFERLLFVTKIYFKLYSQTREVYAKEEIHLISHYCTITGRV